MTPFEVLVKLAAQSMEARDQQLFNQWKQTGKSEDFENLYASMKPYMSRITSMYNVSGVPVPQAVVNAQAKIHFKKAVDRYDPNKGPLRPFVSQSLNKVKSQVSKWQNLSRIPETRVFDIGRLRREIDRLGGDAAKIRPKDLARRLEWTEKKVRTMISEAPGFTLRSKLPVSQEGRFGSPESQKLMMMGKELSGDEKKMFDLVFKEKVHSTGDLSKKMRISPSKVSVLKNRLFERARPIVQSGDYD